ncbi:hypothetical protein QBC35DRAFT_412782 [Podospora australis]|uniref:Alkyl hydroperoxide reductase subunit C/ Thiol specific antioxidant domain-containing protein n=1 Tax=Podospora australis TaxID=1536484 RepID=A0AAN6WS44_9PEZI|nr:hypothetical protein QBC35DRAFT_412782 [Podospora australis]
MFSNLAAKAALKKVGLPSDTLDSFNKWAKSDSSSSSSSSSNTKPNKLTKSPPAAGSNDGTTTTKWNISIKSLPLTVQPWFTPKPPPIPISAPPKIGDFCPVDSTNRGLSPSLGTGKKVLVVFLRCVGCAFAQKTFTNLRSISRKYGPERIACIAISHSSREATQKWIDLLGGAGGVKVIIDEERALYASWGLGLGSVWYVLNPTSQVAGFKEKGWLGARVAGSLGGRSAAAKNSQGGKGVGGKQQQEEEEETGPTTTMGNKWQEAGAWAVDGRGKIVWGGKALRADDVMELDAGVAALGIA